jgi:hypothetical protein
MPRPYIAHINISEIEPTSRAPGRFSYMLSRDSDTTARTAVQRVVPTGDFKAEPMAHYHHTTEEILVLKGLMSFDSKVWLAPMSYVFHPAQFVHGFASALPVETLYISRVGADLDFNYVPEPASQAPYFVGTAAQGRDLVYAPNALGGPWEPLPPPSPKHNSNWLQVLSYDAATGEGTALVRLVAGNVATRVESDVERELFLLEGEMTDEDGVLFTQYSYGCWPPHTTLPRFDSQKGALMYLHCSRDLLGVLSAMGLRASPPGVHASAG